MAYNGYKNWTTWNVALWLHNTEIMHGMSAVQACKKQGADQAGFLASLCKEVWGKTTPDGAQLRQADWKEVAESLREA